MAEISIPTETRGLNWLDRPIVVPMKRVRLLLAHWELWAYAALILVAFSLRIWDVGARALHHDESLHAYFSWKLFAGQGYAYDPLMHGPLQFEVVPLFYLLLGDTETAARMFAVLTGTVLVGLPYFLRRELTRPGALLAAAMLAISPAMVYFSRFIRDDMYLACFTLIMFICIVKYLERPRASVLYVLAASAALAMASMEAAYLHFFIFGSFLIVEGVREAILRVQGPVLSALKKTSADTWLTALSIFVVITVVCYSTFFTNPYGIWDTRQPLFLPGHAWSLSGLNPARKDILGGLAYWKAQHTVQRGGEPTYYYLLLLPLYEQLALVFGLAGVVYAAVRRSLVRTFLVWWAVMAFGLYSWAGEKMPWLVIHITLPLVLLAATSLSAFLQRATKPLAIACAAAALALAALELHSTFFLNYVDAANPVEMLIYVQSSQDVPNVTHELENLSLRTTHGLGLPIGLDTNDVGGWPFTWYLRHFTNVTQTTSFSGNTCGGAACAALLMLGPEYDQFGSALSSQYVAQKYRWNWWFPQDYMTWFPNNMGGPFAGKVAPPTGIGSSTDWLHVWNWLIYRRPFADPTGQNARWLYLLVRRDLVPGSHYFKPVSPALAGATARFSVRALAAHYTRAIGSQMGGTRALGGPRGLASDPHGNLYVADPINHRIVRYSAGGTELNIIGSAGTGPGQFAERDSPQGVAVGPDGNVYAADTWNQRIEVFSPSGKFIRAWGGGPIGTAPGQFYGPRSLAVGSNGRVYVADTGNKRIQVFSPHGKILFTFGGSGAGNGQFNEPSSVAVSRSGTVYVADFWNRRIQTFSAAGAFKQSWPMPGWTFGSYDEPYLAVDNTNGDVYASDPVHAQVIAFAPSGKVLGAIGPQNLTLPVGLATLPGTTIAIGDVTQDHVALFRVAPRGPQAPRPGAGPTQS